MLSAKWYPVLGLKKVTRHISSSARTATERKKTEWDWMRDGEGGKKPEWDRDLKHSRRRSHGAWSRTAQHSSSLYSVRSWHLSALLDYLGYTAVSGHMHSHIDIYIHAHAQARLRTREHTHTHTHTHTPLESLEPLTAYLGLCTL